MEDITGIGQIANASADVIKTVIDKIANAVGIIYNDSDYKMKKDAKKKLYEEIINNPNYNEYAKCYLITNLNSEMKAYENNRLIVQKAIANIDDDANVQLVDDEWLNFFFDRSKNVSSCEMQDVWAKILSEEFNRPRSIPKSLLHTVSCIDLELAKVFNNVCQFTAFISSEKTIEVFIDIDKFKDDLKEYNIYFETLIELDRYGLITFDSNLKFCLEDVENNIELMTDSKIFIIKPDVKKHIPIGNVIFTKDGLALCKCIVRDDNILLCNMIKAICGSQILEEKNKAQ